MSEIEDLEHILRYNTTPVVAFEEMTKRAKELESELAELRKDKERIESSQTDIINKALCH